MIDSIIENRIVEVPWPLYVNGKLYQGDRFNAYPECSDSCKLGIDGADDVICQHGLTHITRKVAGNIITVSGIYVFSGSLSKKYKKNTVYMQRKVSLESVKSWFSMLDKRVSTIQSLVVKSAKNDFEQFHEFVKWAREIGYYSERLLNKSDKSKTVTFDNASDDLKSLYKTSTMLLDALDTTAIYFNPESAKFGRKKLTDLYSMVHKMKLVLSHSATNSHRANVIIKGRVENKHKIYGSFKIVPLSLIQNAIKYKKSGDVEVIFEEAENKLSMSVVSIGDQISDDEITKLFIRGYRTKKAYQMSVEGSGLGLYVSKVVLDAHDFNILVTSTPVLPENKKLARNVFTVNIH